MNINGINSPQVLKGRRVRKMRKELKRKRVWTIVLVAMLALSTALLTGCKAEPVPAPEPDVAVESMPTPLPPTDLEFSANVDDFGIVTGPTALPEDMIEVNAVDPDVVIETDVVLTPSIIASWTPAASEEGRPDAEGFAVTVTKAGGVPEEYMTEGTEFAIWDLSFGAEYTITVRAYVSVPDGEEGGIVVSEEALEDVFMLSKDDAGRTVVTML